MSQQSVQPGVRLARSDAIIFNDYDDDTVVMMDTEVGRYYELNPVGARIWALVESRPWVAGVCEALLAEYEVTPDTCGEEVQAFIDKLHRLEVLLASREPKEVGKDGTRDQPVTPSGSRKEAAARQQGMEEAKLAWITPAIRVMRVAHTATGPPGKNTYETQNYAPSS